MIWIPDGAESNYLEAKEKIDFEAIINTRRFTVKDSPLTYRQANSMAEDNMLPKDENRENGWRKFSLKELIYIELVLSLKRLGLKHSQLRSIWNSFFREYEDIPEDDPHKYHNKVSDEMIAYVMGHIDIVITVTESGDINFMHPVFFTLCYPKDEPFVFVGFSEIVNKVAKRLNKSTFEPRCNIKSVNHYLTKKEEKALDLIRNDDFKSIKLVKKDGDIETIHTEKNIPIDKNSLKAIIDSIKYGSYQSLSIKQRDGQMVNITQEETIKV